LAEESCDLEVKAREIRRLILKSVHHAGAGHLGGPLSASDILAALYFKVLRVDPSRPDWPDRDRFILSKGHSAIGWYAALALRGYFPVEELQTFDSIDCRLQGHPDMTKTPGVDMSAGSLGQGLSAGIGMALGAKLANKDFHTWVMIGDGELQEGQIWEAVQVASRFQLGGLTAILDYNQLSQFGWTYSAEGYAGISREPPLIDPGRKFESFNWNVIEIDGHDMQEILAACTLALATKGKPTLIVARTIKGKGVSFMEGHYAWHAKPMTEEDFRNALAELDVSMERMAIDASSATQEVVR
jgi:transketolase